MNRKSKGTAAERELVNLFWAGSWACIRVAGSGSVRHPSPDLLAGQGHRTLAIEVKASRSRSVYLSKEEIRDLISFSAMFGAEPWVGIRFDRVGWYFITPEDMVETPSHFVASLEKVRMTGLLFEELTTSKGTRA